MTNKSSPLKMTQWTSDRAARWMLPFSSNKRWMKASKIQRTKKRNTRKPRTIPISCQGQPLTIGIDISTPSIKVFINIWSTKTSGLLRDLSHQEEVCILSIYPDFTCLRQRGVDDDPPPDKNVPGSPWHVFLVKTNLHPNFHHRYLQSLKSSHCHSCWFFL